MGLLDEAIREHLELKRRSGADPSEIAHAEHAALTPVFPDEPRQADAAADAGIPGDAPVDAPAGAVDDRSAPVAELGDETAEIDMQAVMAAEDDAALGGAGSSTDTAAAATDDDGFEWEDPEALAHDADVEGPPEQIPGQERMSLE